MDNSNLRLTEGAAYQGNEAYRYIKLHDRFPDRARILTGVDPLLNRTLPQLNQANRDRVAIWHYLSAVMWIKYEWVSDRDLVGQFDHWQSVRPDYLVKGDQAPPVIRGDCEDLALGALEFALEAGIYPHHCYLFLCLSGAGQSWNRSRPINERRVLDHAVAGVKDPAGDIWLVDSNHKKVRRTQDTRYQWFIHTRLDRDPADWRHTETETLAP